MYEVRRTTSSQIGRSVLRVARRTSKLFTFFRFERHKITVIFAFRGFYEAEVGKIEEIGETGMNGFLVPVFSLFSSSS